MSDGSLPPKETALELLELLESVYEIAATHEEAESHLQKASVIASQGLTHLVCDFIQLIEKKGTRREFRVLTDRLNKIARALEKSRMERM